MLGRNIAKGRFEGIFFSFDLFFFYMTKKGRDEFRILKSVSTNKQMK
jgi:hypothetical protein